MPNLTANDPLVSAKARIARQLKGLRREVERLIDAYQAAAITLAELQERRRQIEDHGRHLQARLDEIRCQRSGREQELRLLQGLEAFCDGIRDALIDPPFETKQKVLRLVIDRVLSRRTDWSSVTSFQRPRPDCNHTRDKLTS